MATFYHQTTSEAWADIQAEGFLWGKPSSWLRGYQGAYRYTYLAPVLWFLGEPGYDVTLEVEYDPIGCDGTGRDNFGFNPPKGEYCCQFSVFHPIPIDKVRRVDPATLPPDEVLIERSKKVQPRGSEPEPRE